MRPFKQKKLADKGWTKTEIRAAEATLEKSNPQDYLFSRMVFWSAMIVIIFANLIVALVMIPFLVALNKLILIFIISLLGLSIGFLYNLLITDLGQLRKKHHILAGILIPLIAITNFFITVYISNRLISDLKINSPQHNPWVISLVFVISFIIPYLFSQLRMNWKDRRSVAED